jgi:hypothetical protein
MYLIYIKNKIRQFSDFKITIFSSINMSIIVKKVKKGEDSVIAVFFDLFVLLPLLNREGPAG